ncbi:MAG: hypothetical protein AAFZ52_09665 [Bacteroidota bacterium]
MTTYSHIPLEIPAAEQQVLFEAYDQLAAAIEQPQQPIAPVLFSDLRTLLRDTWAAQTGVSEVLAAADFTPQALRITADNTRLLNLPWRLAYPDVLQLSITKGSTDGLASRPVAIPDLHPLPLRVLVMISAPESGGTGALNYEAEEERILDAFEPLFDLNQVEVDFCEGGSLATLKAKLAQQHYHILHFSGPGSPSPVSGRQTGGRLGSSGAV